MKRCNGYLLKVYAKIWQICSIHCEAEGKFSDEERSLLSDRSLYGFFNSDLGQRLIASKRVERELPFSMLFDGNRYIPDVENGERLFLQGIIDTVFVEDDQWVLVDYKTDRVKSGDETHSSL